MRFFAVTCLGQTLAEEMISSPNWKRDCFKRFQFPKSSTNFAQVNKIGNPGAGMDPDSIEPYVTILKDGFFKVACVKDAMYEHGDKFGNNKHSYRMGDVTNSSIVHYTEIVPKRDRKEMTHAVCFQFCRGIPDMSFFGINNGRDCYCTPFYKKMASDSSKCDATCEGDDSTLCGGKRKSTIFSMHICDDTEQDIRKVQKTGMKVRDALDTLSGAMKASSEEAEKDANLMQKSFGLAGDPAMAGMMQRAKIWAGTNIHSAKDAFEVVDKLDRLDQRSAYRDKDFTKFEDRKWAESLVKDWQEATVEAGKLFEANSKIWKITQPPRGRDSKDDAKKQYYPIMYFVDKDFEDVPTTCTGDLIDEPILNYDPNECAASCDAMPGRCVGFAFFWADGGVCFLYSKFERAQYYTGCGGSFLQKQYKKNTPFEANCLAKLQFFEGTSLKPDIKCKNCLKEVQRADRCFK